jgi:hypothetical protein
MSIVPGVGPRPMGEYAQALGAGDRLERVGHREHLDAVVGPALRPHGQHFPRADKVELLGRLEDGDRDPSCQAPSLTVATIAASAGLDFWPTREAKGVTGMTFAVKFLGRRVVAGIFALVVILYYFNLWFGFLPNKAFIAPGPYFGGLLVLGLLYALYVVLTGDAKIWNIAVGADGRASTSKFQMLLWLIVVLFGYVVVMTARVQHGQSDPLSNIPPNVLLALGLSIGTATVAKAVTTSNVDNMREVRETQVTGKGLAPLVQSDDGTPDLAKIQLLAWTVVAIGVYLNLLVTGVNGAIDAFTKAPAMPPPTFSLELPDIDASLLVLMGLGSGAYIGRKLNTGATPFITSISKSPAAPGEKLTLTGANFGAAGRLVLAGSEMEAGVTSWADTRIEFVAPQPDPARNWTVDAPLKLVVQAPLGESANSVHLTLHSPA